MAAADKSAVLAGILQRAMDAAGIHDEDPETLPDRILEIRFLGPTYVYSGPYPQRGKLKAEEKPRRGRQGIATLDGAR